MKKCKIIFVLLLSLSLTKAIANDTIVIPQNMFQIDYIKKLILVNYSVNQINTQWSNEKSVILLDDYYTFDSTITNVKIGQAYQVKSGDVNHILYFTQLPVIHITTAYQIVDEPRVYAQFLMSEATGLITTSNIGIEIRGGYSQSAPKKSYRFELWEDTLGVTTKDIALLGMRNDDDWNLRAMYNEPLRIRSKTSQELWNNLHQIYYYSSEPEAINGVKIRYVEVFVNHEYAGIYALGERIDQKQLKVKKYNGTIRGEIYKGVDWGRANTFTSISDFNNTSLLWDGFEYEYPDEITDWTNIHAFVTFVVNSTDTNFYTQYKSKFHLDNAIDYFIFLNLTSAFDNAGKNLYIAKYKANDPYFYVPWDLDGVFGNDWTGARINITNAVLSNGLYDRLIKDCSATGFVKKLYQRWGTLRNTTLTHSNIMAMFTQNHDLLNRNAAYEREKMAWPDFSYDSTEISFISAWTAERLYFLDDLLLNSSGINQAISLASPTDDYGQGIEITLNTESSITAANQLTTGSKVTYKTGEAIILAPGFSAGQGSIFKAQVKRGCPW